MVLFLKGLGFRRAVKPSNFVEVIRSQVKKLEEDRPLYDDMNRLAVSREGGVILDAVQGVANALN